MEAAEKQIVKQLTPADMAWFVRQFPDFAGEQSVGVHWHALKGLAAWRCRARVTPTWSPARSDRRAGRPHGRLAGSRRLRPTLAAVMVPVLFAHAVVT